MSKKNQLLHWADVAADRVIREKGDKKSYTVAAGITPSGTVHIGNFREIITVDLVARALKDMGKKVRFIYSWDDYDVLRKVPKNMPKQDLLKKHLRRSIVDVPDPFGEHENYARHNEAIVEKEVKVVGIEPEFLYQAKKYRACEYSESIKVALQNASKIKKILDEYREEPLREDWLPLTGFCPACKKDDVSFSDYDGGYCLKMTCHDCKKNFNVDIRKDGFIKLFWRVDWPMRWSFEKVDFEPGGKDHSTEGGSFSTGRKIVEIFGWTAPTYQVYDFIRIKGGSGKISSSSGEVVTVSDCREVYEPEMLRWLFAGTRPNTEFAISFDADVIKLYEDFDRCERIFFGKEKVDEKTREKQKRTYELSMVDKVPKKIPIQPSFRHLTNILLASNMDVKKAKTFYDAKDKFDKRRLDQRVACAKNWLEKFAPEEFRFSVQDSIPKTLKISKGIKDALHEVARLLEEKKFSGEELHKELYEVCHKFNVGPKEFFKSAYQVLISKDEGPQLSGFIITIGQKKVADLFSRV